jgi:hypothetical protein
MLFIDQQKYIKNRTDFEPTQRERWSTDIGLRLSREFRDRSGRYHRGLVRALRISSRALVKSRKGIT